MKTVIVKNGVDQWMIANNVEPYIPTHPGEVIKEEIEYRKISQRKLASQMGVSGTMLNEILNTKRPVNSEFALLVEAALGLDAEMLVNMQTRFNMQMIRKDSSFGQRLEGVRKVCASLL